MVDAHKNESIEHLLKRFKLECDREGIVNEMKKREYFISPSAKRHKKDCDVRHRQKLDKLQNKRDGGR